MATSLLVVGASTVSVSGAMARDSAPPPPDAVTRVGAIPNYFYSHGQSSSNDFSSFLDPVNNVFIETSANVGVCPNVVAYDTDTYRLVGQNSHVPGPGQCSDNFTLDTVGGTHPDAAIDSTDALFLIQDQAVSNPSIVTNGLTLVAEHNLAPVVSWVLPPPPLPMGSDSPSGLTSAVPAQTNIVGVTWDSVRDLMVVTAKFNNPASASQGAPVGVQVAAYDIKGTLKSRTPVLLWNETFSSCQSPLTPSFATAGANLATREAALYVPCQLQEQPQRNGVLKVAMTTAGCQPPAVECPDPAHETTTPMPGAASDAYFDPGSDRVFFPANANDGVDLLVYDGHDAAFLGKANVGDANDVDESAFTIDTSTGRLYAIGPDTGMTLVDGRQTPLAPGIRLGEAVDRIDELQNTFSVATPDAAFPYTRLFVNDDVGKQRGQPFTGTQPDFAIYADTIAVAVEAPSSSIDQNASSGTVSGNARGFGFHTMLIGNYTSSANNLLSPDTVGSVPFGNGNDDALGAAVQELQLQQSTVQGSASAMADGNGTLSYGVGTCTGGVTSVTACAPPPVAVPVDPSTVPAPPVQTSQGWPFPTAVCNTPGQPSHESFASASSGSSSALTAAVDCLALTAAADFSGWDSTPASLPTVNVDQGTTATHIVTSPRGTSVTSSATATAKGIHIDLGSGVGIFIGEVSQSATTTANGEPGGARATDALTTSDIVMNGQELCGSANCAAAIQQINTQFPAQIHIDAPALDHRDDRYASGCAPDSQNAQQLDCKGSPGGYIAAMEADQVEQFGDEQFNGMSSAEASYLPGMRIVLYGYQDGEPNLNREVLDLAGVEVDSEQGNQQLDSFDTTVTPSQVSAACSAAGCTPAQLQQPPSANPLPPPAVTSGGGAPPAGILGLAQRVFNGMLWLVRTPLGALQMGSFLMLLGTPIAMMRRRWRWGANKKGEVA